MFQYIRQNLLNCLNRMKHKPYKIVPRKRSQEKKQIPEINNFPDIKISIIGSNFVGKSLLFNQIKKESYYTYKETDVSGDDTVREIILRNNSSRLQFISDTSGSQAEGDIEKTGQKIANSDIVFVVYAVNNKKSFYDIEEIYTKMIQKYCPQITQVILIGNKNDTREENLIMEEDSSYISFNRGNKLCKKHKWIFFEISAIKDNQIDKIIEYTFKLFDFGRRETLGKHI